MQINIELVPLRGIRWESKSINIMDTKQKVESILGITKLVRDKSYYYFENELRFDFDEKGHVEFIEFLGGIEGRVQPWIYGVEAFRLEADVLYEILKIHNDGEIDDSEGGYSYAFINSSVGVYRTSTPKSVKEMIEEMENEGIDTINNEMIEEEKKKAAHWETIGIGKVGYYL